MKYRSRMSRSACIRTTRKGFGRTARRRSIQPIRSRMSTMSTGFGGETPQTAPRTPTALVHRSSERVEALSDNHDLLVRNEWKGVEIADLVRAQLAHFAGLIGSRITVQGPKLRLNAASAQAIGLALHELATNAGKYGALSTDNGHVDIGWGIDDDTLTMSWAERAGPLVLPPERRGVGTTGIEAMAERTLGGK